MTKSSPFLKAGKDLIVPFTNEGTKPTGQGQTICLSMEGVDCNTSHLTLMPCLSASPEHPKVGCP